MDLTLLGGFEDVVIPVLVDALPGDCVVDELESVVAAGGGERSRDQELERTRTAMSTGARCGRMSSWAKQKRKGSL